MLVRGQAHASGMEHTAVNVTLTFFSDLGLALTLAVATIRQLPELFRALHDARDALSRERPRQSDSEG